MAIPKGVQRLLIGTFVRTKKAIHWHELSIPRGTIGVIKRIENSGNAALVKFDDGRKYGSFVCWIRELAPA